MAAVIVQRGDAHEVWVEDDPSQFDGGSPAVVIDTRIRMAYPDDLNHVRIRLYLQSIDGAPVVNEPVATVVNGYLRVTFQNTAAPGNRCKYKLEVERIWSASR